MSILRILPSGNFYHKDAQVGEEREEKAEKDEKKIKRMENNKKIGSLIKNVKEE